jgi:hypothetical protein
MAREEKESEDLDWVKIELLRWISQCLTARNLRLANERRLKV